MQEEVPYDVSDDLDENLEEGDFETNLAFVTHVVESSLHLKRNCFQPVLA